MYRWNCACSLLASRLGLPSGVAAARSAPPVARGPSSPAALAVPGAWTSSLRSPLPPSRTSPGPISAAMSTNDSLGDQKVVGEKEVLGKSRWLQLVNVSYTRGEGESTWQYVERCTRSTTCDVDAVCIFSIIKTPGQPSKVVIVKQFRPPLNTYTVELPAGLVDEGETAEDAALRELKEETGFIGKVIHTGGKQYLSPGLTNECVRTVFVEVDASTQTLQDKHDAGFITVEMIELEGLMETLEKLEAKGYAIWVGLHSIAQALKLKSIIGDV